jgi:hypothetical protein
MAQRADKTETGSDQVRLPAGLVLKPAVSLEELNTNTEYDPEGAEEFVALIRALRKESSRAIAL